MSAMNITSLLNDTIANTSMCHSTTFLMTNPPEEQYASVLLVLLVILTVVGNSLVVIAIGRFKELRTVTNYMILSLAIADLAIGVFVMPINISNEVLHYWPLGQPMCDLWHSVDVLASTASILNLCIISLDRYWAVTEPISYPRLMSKKRGILCISIVWICSILISFPTILWWRLVDDIVPKQCHFTTDTVYLLISSMISFYIPVAVMVAVYIKIFLVIKQQSKQYNETLRAHRGGEGSERNLPKPNQSPISEVELETMPSVSDLQYSGNDNGNPGPEQMTTSDTETSNLKLLIQQHRPLEKKRISSSSNEIKVARTLGLVLGVFLIFWLPFFVCNLIFAVCEECMTEKIFIFVTWLGHVNSGVNPVIYALSMKEMRRAFISILLCRQREYIGHRKNRRRKLALGASTGRTAFSNNSH